MVSEYITDLPLFRSSMMSRMEALGLISYSPALSAESLPIGAHAKAEDAGVADQAAALELVGDVLDAGVRLDQEGVAIGRGAGLR